MTEWRRTDIERYLKPIREESRGSYKDPALGRALFSPRGKAYPLVMMTLMRWTDGGLKIDISTKTGKNAWWSSYEGLPNELFPEFVAFISSMKDEVTKARS